MATIQPNILFLFTDQLRFDAIAAHGNPMIKTPNIDRLVREGTSFSHAYTPSPVCVPARCSLVTGQPAHVTGVVDNTAMPFERSTFMQRLTESGYRTHGVGKMHFDPDYKNLWGFQTRDISEEGKSDTDYALYLKEEGYGHIDNLLGLRSEYYYIPQPSQLPDVHHETTWVADRSIEFLKQHDGEQPFFLWSSFIKPHPPFESPNPWHLLYRAFEMDEPFRPDDMESFHCLWNKIQNRYKYKDGGYDKQLFRTMRAAYYGCVSHIDYQVGRILDALGDAIDDTLIVFSADHGEMLGDYGCVGKRCMLEPSARIPMIARQPGRFAAGATCEAPASLIDIGTTFLSAAGGDFEDAHTTSQDLSDVAQGSVSREVVISQFSDKQWGLYLVTDGEWKYIYSAGDAQEWLFDLREGVETVNRAEHPDCAAIQSRLKAALFGQFAADGYFDPIEAGDWRPYACTTLPKDPDYGLLLQDAEVLQQRVNELGPGYARSVTKKTDENFKIIFDHMNSPKASAAEVTESGE
ncbi:MULTISPECIES: sulfatase [unclassified Lentimonas]|uniref:sulfatase family protein n=1 Tax=unclassified Lentimonas TaxID=2630993 RepID=UPI001320EC02|nr:MULTISPECIES: sulfatase-like hydrolase/transferase [unclassified Lentimonas]CAA6679211.1 Choline-sulfatase (EC [Lentimonas sp. CC4]CAA6685875.1 Choline-sulfatase (EC [Lentimonas sp. CC6]CAA7076034.1 Choline-sulfatase (EC [Lentimonas sp. CC4]CAA7168533.1 Choline-sulfatase (EC [Lentimonas sp. CC21]CAA7180927.1 Choline-sulfatase (EC [Lentimonas sp. CC8]